jgi:hypothetical protein
LYQEKHRCSLQAKPVTKSFLIFLPYPSRNTAAVLCMISLFLQYRSMFWLPEAQGRRFYI